MKDLSLQRVDYPRHPALDPETDHNVLWKGRPIGRTWKHRYVNHPWASKPDWYWYWGTRDDRIEGHAATVEAAMLTFAGLGVESVRRSRCTQPNRPPGNITDFWPVERSALSGF